MITTAIQDIDAEKAIIGSLILNSELILECQEKLNSKHFYTKAHSDIFQCLIDMDNNNIDINPVTVSSELKKQGHDGELSYINSLTSQIWIGGNIDGWINIITESHVKREIMVISSKLNQLANSGNKSSDILEKAEKLILSISDNENKDNSVLVKDSVKQSIERINETIENGRDSVMTNYQDLDHQLGGGLSRGAVTVIAARPAAGKSSLASNICENVAENGGVVALFSLEMTAIDITDRMIARQASVNLSDIRNAKLKDDETVRVIKKCAYFDDLRLIIDDRSNINVTQIKTACRKLKNKYKQLDLIVIDYLQLLAGEGENINQKVAKDSRFLKILAKELNTPVIVLSQLNRASESAEKLMLSHLRDSGSIEQDADQVILMTPCRDATSCNNGLVLLDVAKNRNGSTGQVTLEFLGKHTAFRDTRRKYEHVAKTKGFNNH